MRHAVLSTLAATAVLTGCATPPDGSRIQRLPETSAPVALSDDEKRALTELNARLLAEQEQVRAREDALAAQRSAPPPVTFGLGYDWGSHWDPWHSHGWGGHGWVWSGSRWVWRPRFSAELWVPLGR